MEGKRIKLKKDDKVKVIVGKEKGKIGKILKIDRKAGRVVVENINMVKRHTKKTAKAPQGGIVEREAGVNVSNLMLMCNKCVSPVRIKTKTLEDGGNVRVCLKCDEVIDK